MDTYICAQGMSWLQNVKSKPSDIFPQWLNTPPIFYFHTKQVRRLWPGRSQSKILSPLLLLPPPQPLFHQFNGLNLYVYRSPQVRMILPWLDSHMHNGESGYKLPAKHVIHTVGPCGENPAILRCCYLTCLELAVAKGLRTIVYISLCLSLPLFCPLAHSLFLSPLPFALHLFICLFLLSSHSLSRSVSISISSLLSSLINTAN